MGEGEDMVWSGDWCGDQGEEVDGGLFGEMVLDFHFCGKHGSESPLYTVGARSQKAPLA